MTQLWIFHSQLYLDLVLSDAKEVLGLRTSKEHYNVQVWITILRLHSQYLEGRFILSSYSHRKSFFQTFRYASLFWLRIFLTFQRAPKLIVEFQGCFVLNFQIMQYTVDWIASWFQQDLLYYVMLLQYWICRNFNN